MTQTATDLTAAFRARMDAAPTHVLYFTRGGGNCLITQTMGTVVEETPAHIIIDSAANEKRIRITRADLLERSDDHVRLTEDRVDAVFAKHGDQQNLRH